MLSVDRGRLSLSRSGLGRELPGGGRAEPVRAGSQGVRQHPTNTYNDRANPWGSVITAGSGVKIKVVKESANAQIQTLQVIPGPATVGFRKAAR